MKKSPIVYRDVVEDYATPAKKIKTPTQIREEYALVKSFKTQIEEDRKIESARCDLALCSDFNLLDAFRLEYSDIIESCSNYE